jgi:hypothetical protein
MEEKDFHTALKDLFFVIAEELKIPQFVEWLNKKLNGL